MTDDASKTGAGAIAGGPIAPARAMPPLTIRKVPPPTAEERQLRRDAMERAIRFGATPYRDAEGKARYVLFKDANNAPVEAWRRDPRAKRGFRRTQQARKAAGQLIWHPEDQIELAKRLGVIYYREGRSAEGAAERGLYDAIWRYEHVWQTFTAPRRIGPLIIDTGRLAALAEEEARKLQAEDPKARGGFFVRDRKNIGLIYVVPKPDPEAEEAVVNTSLTGKSPEDDLIFGGQGNNAVAGQANTAKDPDIVQAGLSAPPSVTGMEDLPEQEKAAVLHYPDVPLPRLEPSWKMSDEPTANVDDMPVINMKADRIQNILANEPAIFEIEDWDKAVPSMPIYEFAPYGWWAVWLYQDVIEYEADRQGVDPNLIKATIYFENARGASYGHIFEDLGLSDTILPMNISEEKWTGLLGADADISDPLLNIKAGTLLLRRIQERIVEPTVAKVSSIYHISGREKVHDNGARVSQFYKERPWERANPVLQNPASLTSPSFHRFWKQMQQRRAELRRRIRVERTRTRRAADQ